MLPLCIVGLLLLVGDNPLTSSPRLPVIDQAPSFKLTTQDEKSLSLADLRGKVVLVSFIFTTCNGTCPATTHRMSQVQQTLHARALDKAGGVHLLSISLDPARDTPEVLKRYQKLYDADPVNWTFLTGQPEVVAKVVTSWGMWARPAPNGQLDHPSRVFLVDGLSRIREIYNLNFLKPDWVAEDIAGLLAETDKP